MLFSFSDSIDLKKTLRSHIGGEDKGYLLDEFLGDEGDIFSSEAGEFFLEPFGFAD